MKRLIVLLTTLLFIAACTSKPVEDCMAVEFTASGQNIAFTPNITIPEEISFAFWYKADSYGFDVLNAIISAYPSDSSPTASVSLRPSDSSLVFQYAYSVSPFNLGSWKYAGAPIGAWTHVVITYNNNNVANNPIFYVNGALVSISEEFAPTSSSPSDTFTNLYFSFDYDGKLQDVRIYNRILSASEIATLYNSRCLRVLMNGLVFWAPMWGTNAQSFDGLTLTSSHRITDWVNGAVGTPAGSPIGRANTIQSLK